MRQITRDAVYAFNNGYKFRRDNTRVAVDTDGDRYFYLHNNLIAFTDSDKFYITDGGWQSNTTKERLNGILSGTSFSVYQKNWTWYIHDSRSGENYEWDKLEHDGKISITKLYEEA